MAILKIANLNTEWMVHFFRPNSNKFWAGASRSTGIGSKPKDVPQVCSRLAGVIEDLDADHKHLKENDILRKCFKLVSEAEGILFLNYEKNGIKGYIGTSSLMEMGIAYHLNKKLFLLNDIPSSKEHRWAHEVNVMAPIILNRDLKKIQNL